MAADEPAAGEEPAPGPVDPATEVAEDGGGAAADGEEAGEAGGVAGEAGETVEAGADGDPAPGSVKRSGVDPFERLAHAYSEKAKGLEAYNKEEFEGAIESWSMARGTIKHILERNFFDGFPDKIAECEAQHIKLHLNLAQASLKNKEFYQAIAFCNKVLAEPCHDSKNVKALYRRASAEIMGSSFKEARQTLSTLLEIEPGNAGALQLGKEADMAERKAKATAKKASQKIFAGMTSDHDERIPLTRKDHVWSWLRCSWCRRRKSD